MRSRTKISILICVILFIWTTANAQLIGSYAPTEHDFGSISLGNTATQVFTVSVLDAGLLTVYAVDLGSNSSSPPDPYLGDSFEIISPLPPTVPSGTSFEIEVQFSPTTVDEHNAYLWIVTDATNEPEIFIPLNGVGVSSEDPSGQIADILNFFDDSVAAGSIVGSGPGSSAENRLNALRNMLLSLQDLIKSGDYEGACEQLLDALIKCDGDPIPPDFATGLSASDLAGYLQDLETSIGCL